MVLNARWSYFFYFTQIIEIRHLDTQVKVNSNPWPSCILNVNQKFNHKVELPTLDILNTPDLFVVIINYWGDKIGNSKEFMKITHYVMEMSSTSSDIINPTLTLQPQ